MIELLFEFEISDSLFDLIKIGSLLFNFNEDFVLYFFNLFSSINFLINISSIFSLNFLFEFELIFLLLFKIFSFKILFIFSFVCE